MDIKRLTFANDQLCIRCGHWYEPMVLSDDKSVCQRCASTRPKDKQAARRIYGALKDAYIELAVLDPSTFGFVYFIRGKTTKLIKVGFSTQDPHRRLGDLQVGSPDILELMGCIEAPPTFEKTLHHVLSGYRSHREWFEGVLGFVQWIKRFSFMPERTIRDYPPLRVDLPKNGVSDVDGIERLNDTQTPQIEAVLEETVIQPELTNAHPDLDGRDHEPPYVYPALEVLDYAVIFGRTA